MKKAYDIVIVVTAPPWGVDAGVVGTQRLFICYLGTTTAIIRQNTQESPYRKQAVIEEGRIGVQDGDLDSVLKRRGGKPIPEDEIMIVFVQICMGLDHVHSKVPSLSQNGLDPQSLSLAVPVCCGSYEVGGPDQRQKARERETDFPDFPVH